MIPQPRTCAIAVGISTLAELERSGEAWDDLLRRAEQPNPHLSRHALAAHRAADLAGGSLRFVTAWRGHRLEAALPFELRRDIVGLGGRMARPFLSPLVTATAPLVTPGDGEAVAALVNGLAANGAWRWPLLPTGSPAGSALMRALESAGWSVAAVSAFERPVLQRRASYEAFLDGHPHRSRLKDLRRRERRLAELGAVAFTTATEGADLTRVIEAFLTLEQAGWKGDSGTAMACRPATDRLARALFSGSDGPVRARADILSLDGTPIAISLALVAGGTATLLKTAYDERHRALAPGLLLEERIVRAIHETGFAERLDSATLSGSALESLYRDRETVADIIAFPPGSGGLSLERRLRLARLEEAARAEAKRLLRR
ncbi:CelD/BcsL family acetyltransferase involved in cellulose biosynthesis [Methylobacterium sp. BE186]|uniref:GNAT family N-acetyltransferase n=1 Tax=Methylobacterium sp. BE186 TaxID=2817715 RepID=UPI002863E24F|nr:GNAT family N-acetyltransferase [Methylobacterium sp. BE186]MDR7037986.1 CelD/BcsL family acetyltransferase involved in cellulose biosynthesis [Methylobacterium sp. BE186]